MKMEINESVKLLEESIFKVEQMLSVNEGRLETNLESTLKFVLNTLISMKSSLDNGQDISKDIRNDFDKVLSFSGKLFNGNSLDDKMWKIDSLIG